MFTKQLEGHLERGHVLIAEAAGGGGDGGGGSSARGLVGHTGPEPARIGYCIGVDKYFKREDVGIVYQMNIMPGRQRGLVGATLLQALFARWPYGVRLYGCWCAQDLAANRFWEAMGFVPLAFRAGSRKRDRIHIFWQKRVRTGDTRTDWWFPSQTGSGALREDRIVLPIPPGVHWSEAKPRVLPEVGRMMEASAAERKALEDASKPSKQERAAARTAKRAAEANAAGVKAKQGARAKTVAAGGLRFGAAGAAGMTSTLQSAEEAKQDGAPAPPKKHKKQALKNDPVLVAAARELRDRWLEQVAAQPGLLADREQGKYAVGKRVDERVGGREEAAAEVEVEVDVGVEVEVGVGVVRRIAA